MSSFYIPFVFLSYKGNMMWLTWSKSYVKYNIQVAASYAAYEYKNSRGQIDDYVEEHFIKNDNVEIFNYMPIISKKTDEEEEEEIFFKPHLQPNQHNIASALRNNSIKTLERFLEVDYLFLPSTLISMAIDQSCSASTLEFLIEYLNIDDIDKKDILRACDKDVNIDVFYYLTIYMKEEDIEDYIKAIGREVSKLNILNKFFPGKVRKNIPLFISTL
jgi:hypothetical protein